MTRKILCDFLFKTYERILHKFDINRLGEKIILKLVHDVCFTVYIFGTGIFFVGLYPDVSNGLM